MIAISINLISNVDYLYLKYKVKELIWVILVGWIFWINLLMDINGLCKVIKLIFMEWGMFMLVMILILGVMRDLYVRVVWVRIGLIKMGCVRRILVLLCCLRLLILMLMQINLEITIPTQIQTKQIKNKKQAKISQ